jgi:hypothetical protein
MKCNAMLFNLESVVNKAKTGTNNFLTFIDMDTGESFRTYVDVDVAAQYKKLKQYELSLSISVGEFNGKPQLNTRIMSMVPVANPEVMAPETVSKPDLKEVKHENPSDKKALSFG